jgi:hypothetical protein
MRARLVLGFVAATALVAGSSLRAESKGNPRPVLDRIVTHITDYYSRAQSLIGHEEVVRQPIHLDLSMEGFPTRYGYQLRLEWTPPDVDDTPKATMLRELLTVNGRRPKPKDKPRCSQPKETWEEPLAMFLPEARDAWEFKWAGTGRMDGRPTVSLDFQEKIDKDKRRPEAEWAKSDDEACVSFSIPGRTRGRVWVDAETGEVLRLDESILGPIDIDVPREQQKYWHTSLLTLDRWTKSIRYKRVRFDEPAESMMLPESIQQISIMRGGAQPMRITQRFRDYRRFLTGGRLVE